LCCIRPDGRFARVYVGSYGPTYVWWFETRDDFTRANVKGLGEQAGSAFWYEVGRSESAVSYETRDEVYAVHPDLPRQTINLATTERPK
jgi:hypothetical protein